MNEPAQQMIADLETRGVRLLADGGRLILDAPKGALTLQEVTRIRAAKPELLALLASTAGGPPILREIAALPPAPCQVRGCPEHSGPSALPEEARPR